MNKLTKDQQKSQSTKKTATAAQSEEDWCMLPDVEDIEKIVKRELKKLEEFERYGYTTKK